MTLLGFTALSVEIRMNRSARMPLGRFRDDPAAGDIVLDRLARVVLHQRHVLVRRGVKDNLGLELLEHVVHAPGIGHVANDLVK